MLAYQIKLGRRMRTNRQLICWILLLATCALTINTGSASAHVEQTNYAGLVVQFGDGSVFTSCVEFTEPDISGYDVLVRAGLSVEAYLDALAGPGVCSINDEGCPASNCFCQCTGVPCVYWAYSHLVNGTWQYSNLGAGTYRVGDGGVEGWAWGEGSPAQGMQPPAIPFDQICAPVTPTDTPAPPTATMAPPTATSSQPTQPAPAPTPVIWFRLDQNPIAAGECTTVRWDTSGATHVYLDDDSVVYLDDDSVSRTGSREVCPIAGAEYVLRVVSESGEMSETLVLGVTGATASTSPAPAPTVTSKATVPVAASPSSTPVLDNAKVTTAAPTEESTPTSTLSKTPSATNTLPTPTASATQTAPPPASDTVAREPDPVGQGKMGAEVNTTRPTGYAAFGVILVVLIGLTTFGRKLWH